MVSFKYIQNAICTDTCAQLTQLLRDCKEKGIAVQDDQCPKSYSVRDNPELDRVLEMFTARMCEETGLDLIPTYAYARYYQPGEVLEVHTDRESCEVSATVTLGFDGDVWPLFIAEKGTETDRGIVGQDGKIFRIQEPQEFKINVGDGVIYKGCEVPHWREEFTGQWQAQIFLHYVDANGPYAHLKYDGREKLAHHSQPEPEEILYWYVPNAIATSSCDQMISKFEQVNATPAQVGGDVNGRVDRAIRDVGLVSLPSDFGIGATLTGMGMNINQRAWQFNVTHSNQTDFLSYSDKGHYRTHIDTFMYPKSECRKLTVLAFLNDDFEGGKLYLTVGDGKIYPPQEKGTVLVFPSFIQHGVEPVTKGIRRSIVTWLVGAFFK